MNHLDEIPVEELRRALDDVEEKKPSLRIVAAIAYKNGVSQTELANWFGVRRRTIYSWLKRLEAGSLVRAVSDESRPGRPSKLTDEEQKSLNEKLLGSPVEVGYDEPAWTPQLVRRHLRDSFDVDYSVPSCRRLMKEAGLSYQRSHRAAAAADDADGVSSEPRGAGDGTWMPR